MIKLKIFSNLFFARNDTKLPFYLSVVSVIINILISVSLFNRLGFIIIPIATSISSWINVLLHFYFIKKRNLHNFDSKFIYRFPRMILSVVVMGIILYLLLGFFSDKFDYNESWKFIYLFIIVIVSLISYFLISTILGAFKFNTFLAFFATTGIILSAAYMLYLYKRIIFGLQTNEKLKEILDLDLREMIIMIPLIIVVIIIGIFPNIFLEPMRLPIETIINNYEIVNGK